MTATFINSYCKPFAHASLCWYDWIANSSLPYCRYSLLEEKIVSNSRRDWQDMLVKDFIHIALSSKFWFLFGLILYVSVKSYVHVVMVSSPNHTFFIGKLD